MAGPATVARILAAPRGPGRGLFHRRSISTSRSVPTRTEREAAEALGRGRARPRGDVARRGAHGSATRGRRAAAARLRVSPRRRPWPCSSPRPGRTPSATVADLVGQTVGIPAPGHAGASPCCSALLATAGVPVHQVNVQSFGERGFVGALEARRGGGGDDGRSLTRRDWSTTARRSSLVDLRTRSDAARWLGGRDGVCAPSSPEPAREPRDR